MPSAETSRLSKRALAAPIDINLWASSWHALPDISNNVGPVKCFGFSTSKPQRIANRLKHWPLMSGSQDAVPIEDGWRFYNWPTDWAVVLRQTVPSERTSFHPDRGWDLELVLGNLQENNARSIYKGERTLR